MAPWQAVIETRSYRRNTEDRAAVIPRPDGLVLFVADGVGGRPGGGRAADLATRLVTAAAPDVRNLFDPEPWRVLLSEVDSALHADPDSGETTGVVIGVSEAGLAGASVGDSEAWLLPADASSPVVRLTDHPRRKPYLGYASATPVAFRFPALYGVGSATLLLATDGLFKMADEERIRSAASGPDPRIAAAAVAELARNSSGSFYDDLAAVLCRHGGSPL